MLGLLSYRLPIFSWTRRCFAQQSFSKVVGVREQVAVSNDAVQAVARYLAKHPSFAKEYEILRQRIAGGDVKNVMSLIQSDARLRTHFSEIDRIMRPQRAQPNEKEKTPTRSEVLHKMAAVDLSVISQIKELYPMTDIDRVRYEKPRDSNTLAARDTWFQSSVSVLTMAQRADERVSTAIQSAAYHQLFAAVLTDHPQSAFALGKYLWDVHVSVRQPCAVWCLRKAARLGVAEAAYLLGDAYDREDPSITMSATQLGEELALFYLRQAADADLPHACLQVARLLEEGKGTDVKLFAAADYLRRGGEPMAAERMAETAWELTPRGRAEEQAQLLEALLCCDQQDPEGFFQLGLMHAHSPLGIPRDLEKCEELLKKAEALGHEEAGNSLRLLGVMREAEAAGRKPLPFAQMQAELLHLMREEDEQNHNQNQNQNPDEAIEP